MLRGRADARKPECSANQPQDLQHRGPKRYGRIEGARITYMCRLLKQLADSAREFQRRYAATERFSNVGRHLKSTSLVATVGGTWCQAAFAVPLRSILTVP